MIICERCGKEVFSECRCIIGEDEKYVGHSYGKIILLTDEPMPADFNPDHYIEYDEEL